VTTSIAIGLCSNPFLHHFHCKAESEGLILFLFLKVMQVLHDVQQMQHDARDGTRKTSLLVGLKKIASLKGFVISDNDGSGNCMFYALSEQLDLVKGIQISHAELRQRLVNYLKEKPTLVSWYCCRV